MVAVEKWINFRLEWTMMMAYSGVKYLSSILRV